MTMAEQLVVAELLIILALLATVIFLRSQNQSLRSDLRRVLRGAASKVEAQAAELRWRRAATEASDVIAAVADSDQRLVYLTPAARELFGGFVRGETAIQRFRHHALEAMLDEAQRQGGGGSRSVEINDRRYIARSATSPDEPPYDWLFLFIQDVTDLYTLARARRDMAANLSHELRTPLTSLKLMIETLLGGGLEQPELARRLVSRIANENEALIRLVEDLTALSWIEQGRTSLELEAVSVPALARARLARLTPLLEAKGIRPDLRGDAPMVIPLDPERFGQVLTNLFDNAIKFSGDGAELKIVFDQDEQATSIQVSDTGQGILPKDLPRVFERFYKGDRVRTRRVGGSGLGLAIAKHMVEAHGGTIRVESEFGHGTTFTIRLPNQ